MGVREQILFDYLKDNVRYADLLNGIMFHGEQVVDARCLKEVQRKKSILLKDSSKLSMSYLERERDLLRFHDKEKEKFYLAVEGQSSSDYTMTVRSLTYDGVEYSDQISRNRGAKGLIPVFHIVLYLGEKRWLSRHKLSEMMDVPQKVWKYRELLPEYEIHLADIHEQQPEHFRTEWKDLFQLMKHSRKKEELKKYIEENMDSIRKLSKDTRQLLAVLLDQYEIMEDGKVEVKEMCEAWDGAMMMYREEALAEGMEKGLTQGLQTGNYQRQKQVARNMYLRGFSVKDTMGIVEAEENQVLKWFQEFQTESNSNPEI